MKLDKPAARSNGAPREGRDDAGVRGVSRGAEPAWKALMARSREQCRF